MLFKTLLVTLLSVSGVLCQVDWGVTYTRERICALKGSTVELGCTYTYPTYHRVQKTFWYIHYWYGTWEPKDLYTDGEYYHRVHYRGNLENDCTFRISQLRESDSNRNYRFRFLTTYDGKYSGQPGVTLEVTDLQAMVNPDTVTEGERVTLTCRTTCTLTDSPTFIWYRNESPLDFSNQKHQFTASSEDAGKYSCALKDYEHLSSPAVALNVRYPPKSVSVSVSPSGVIKESSSVTLTCSSDANPPVNRYTWYKTGTYTSRYTSQYTIEKFNYWDAGEYYCEARNMIGSDVSHHINLKVLCLEVEIYPDSVREGEMVKLTCKNTCTHARAFEFYRDGQRLPNSNQNWFRATSENAGNYSCGAIYNKRLSSNAVLLRVKYPPKRVSVSVSPSGVIKEGSSVTLTCSSDANPPVNRYTWYKNSRTVSSETGGPEESYTIKNITLQDAGEYYCKAENGMGPNSSPPKLLDVQYPPKNISVSLTPSGVIKEGSSVTLTCSSDANPPVNRYTWYQNNRTVSSGWSYTINNSTQQHTGEYYCKAENAIGTNSSPCKLLNVQYAPKNTSVSVSPSGVIKEGSSVTLTCSSDANPPVNRYTWYKKSGAKNNRAVPSGTGSGLNHMITNILSEDSGQYYCEVQNQYGAQNSTAVTMDVQYPPHRVSVNSSGVIVEGSSVTLSCSSDAKPPVNRYTWYKKNETGVWLAGSGQRLNFSDYKSWNSGQYYCGVQNTHGAQNSTALLLTVQGGQSLIVAAAVCGTAIVVFVFLGVVCMRRRKSTHENGYTEDREESKSPVYDNVTGMAVSHTETQGTDRGIGEAPLYSSVHPTYSHSQEEPLYSSVKKPLAQCEDDVQYASIQFRPSSAAPRSIAQGAEDPCVIYCKISSCNT